MPRNTKASASPAEPKIAPKSAPARSAKGEPKSQPQHAAKPQPQQKPATDLRSPSPVRSTLTGGAPALGGGPQLGRQPGVGGIVQPAHGLSTGKPDKSADKIRAQGQAHTHGAPVRRNARGR